MCEQDGRTFGIEFGDVLIEPVQGHGRYARLLRLCSFARVQSDNLPAAVSKGVVDLLGEDPLVG